MVKFELYKIKCDNCKVESDNNFFEKTVDGHDVCITCISEARDHYKKGLVTMEEVQTYFKLKEVYKLKQNELSLQIRKYAMYYEKDPVEMLKETIALRLNLSERSFKKGQGFGRKSSVNSLEELNGALTVTMEEHLILINQILENFDLIAKKIPENKYKEVVISRGTPQNAFVTYWEQHFVVPHNNTK